MVTKGLSVADEKLEGVMMKPASYIGKATKSETGKTIGGLAFMIGFGLAVLAGLLAGLQAAGVDLGIGIEASGLMMGVLALIGLIVGLVNVSDKDSTQFLIGAIAITAATGSMGALATLGMGFNAVAVFIMNMMNMVSLFIGPAALIVGLKVVYAAARKA
jgi:hypothetical protein